MIVEFEICLADHVLIDLIKDGYPHMSGYIVQRLAVAENIKLTHLQSIEIDSRFMAELFPNQTSFVGSSTKNTSNRRGVGPHPYADQVDIFATATVEKMTVER